MRGAWALALMALGAAGVRAEAAPEAAIQDNSFLVEEAYNQEEGVVQHISSFTRFRASRDWAYAFTQEWPVAGSKHQISYSLALASPGDPAAGGGAGMGDAALHYRYQALGGGRGRVAFAPRASLLFPTGDERRGRGAGAAGLQINLPFSTEISRRLVAHSNIGATFIPSARNAQRQEADTTGLSLGQSVVYLARPTFNLMLEAAWSSQEEVAGPGKTSRDRDLFLSPGVRWAHNLRSGLQVVPGVALPIGLGAGRGENGVLFYLSFEHPFGGIGGRE